MRLLRNHIAAVTVSLGLLTGLSAHAAVCDAYYLPQKIRTALADLYYDSSVEVEIDLSDKILKQFTTLDGTIGPLFKISKNDRIPAFIRTKAKQKGVPPKKLSWDTLTIKEKRDLIEFVSANRRGDFFDNRKIEGLRFREKVELSFDEDTVFLGEKYKAGKHTVDVSHVLAGPVEYRGPTEVASATGVELHFRGAFSAGTLSHDLRILQRALGVEQTHQHVHIVAPLPIAELSTEKEATAFALTDYYRRANLVAEMLTVYEGGSIGVNETEEAVYFDNISPDNLKTAYRYFLSVADGKRPRLGDKLKMGWIGLRGSDKYDQPDLFGFEFRAIGDYSDPKIFSPVLDTIQYALLNFEKRANKQVLLDWFRTVAAGKPDPSALWYQQTWNTLFKNAHPELAPLLNARMKETLSLVIDGDYREFKMIFFDWTKDPWIMSKRGMAAKVLAAQKKYIPIIDAGMQPDTDPPEELVKQFLDESGLYEFFRKGLDL